MKKNVLLAVLIIISFFGFVNAIDIDSCQTISTPGIYNQTQDIFPNDSISGQCIYITSSNVIYNGGGYSIYNTSWDGEGLDIRGDNITITNFNVSTGEESGLFIYESEDILIENGHSLFSKYSLFIRNVNNITIRNVSIGKGNSNSIYIRNSNDIYILNNSIYPCLTLTMESIVNQDPINNLSILNNTFHEGSSIHLGSLATWYVTGGKIAHNSFLHSTYADYIIDLENSNEFSIYNNTFYNLSDSGSTGALRFDSDSNMQVYNNNISIYPLDYATIISNCTNLSIFDNYFESGNVYGIRVKDIGSNLLNISNNTFDGVSGFGVGFINFDIGVNNSFINDNSFQNAAKLGGAMALSFLGNNTQINRNNVTNCSFPEGYGVLIKSLSNNITFNSNLFNYTDIYFNLDITGTTNSFICNNDFYCSSLGSHGIKTKEESINNSIYGNYLFNCTWGLLAHNGTRDTLWYNNSVFGDSSSSTSTGIFVVDTEKNNTFENITISNMNNGIYLFHYNDRGNDYPSNNTFNKISVYNSSNYGILSYNSSNYSNYFYNLLIINSSFADVSFNISSNNNLFINVSYNRSKEVVDSSSNITSYWYIDASSNIDGTNITITNSTTVLYSALSPNFETQTVLAYINEGGTVTNETYTITAVKDGYVSQSEIFNLTGNMDKFFTLLAEEDSSSSSGSSGTPTYYPTETNLKEGYTRSLGKGWKFRFNFKNESHKFNVDNINGDVVTITVSSDPITFDLKVNESKKVDLDSDGYYDFLISLNEITGSSSYARAEVYVLSIDEKVVEGENDSNENNGNEGLVDGIDAEVEENSWFVYFVLVLIIVIGLISLLKFRKRK